MSIATAPHGPPANPRGKQGSHHQRLARLRDQERQRRSTVVVMSTIAMALLLLGLLGGLDFYFELATSLRLFAWVAIVLALIGLVATRQRWRKFEAVDALREAERAWPDMGQRLRTSHDYQMTPDEVAPASADLVRALEIDTQQRVTSRVIRPLGRSWPVFALLAFCAVAATFWLVALVVWPQWRVASARLMFLPVHYSDVQMEPLPGYVHLGEDLTVGVHVEGRPVQTARVLYRINGESDWRELGLKPSVAGVLVEDLTVVIPDCRSDFEVQIEAGPFRSGIHPIAVRLPLVLEEWTATLQPPAYTGLPAAEGHPEGLRVPEGASLGLVARYNRPPSEVEVGIAPQPASPSPAEVEDAVARLTLSAGREPMDLSIRATATDGMADDSSLHIEVVPDHSPKVKFVSPEPNAEAIPTAELRFTLEAFDDYALTSVGVRYRIDNGPEQTLWESSSEDLSTAVAKTITLPLEDLDLEYPQAITYYAYAVDNRQPEVQRVTSDLRFVDIRPFLREYEFKETQGGNCQGECLTLEKLIKQQREILGRTFAVTQQVAADGSVGNKLAAQEEDLREKTESLTAALEQKVGPMPSLQFAIRAMHAAIQDLSAQALADGQADEEQALSDLVAARRNLRKILKQNNAQAQMCRNVDQEQMDKIRQPQRDQEQNEQQQLAQIREQLKQLAKQQESFCQSALACRQSSPSGSGKEQKSPQQKSPEQESPEQESPEQKSPEQKSASGASVAKSPRAKQDSSSQSASQENTATRQQLVQQQQQSAAKAREIQRELSGGKFGALAPKRAEQAAESIEQSGESFATAESDPQAIAQAKQAAEQLKQLSEHLGRRHNPDFSDKLAAAGRQAEQLADEQQQLSQSVSSQTNDAAAQGESGRKSDEDGAEQQRRLAGRAEELVDLVDQLLSESTQQDWQVQSALTNQVSTNPPRQAAADMNQAAEELKRSGAPAAAKSGNRAADTLKGLAAGIQQVQQAMGPTLLQRLTKAEEQAAALLKDLKRADSPAERAMAEARTRQFADSLRPLASTDAELAEAAAAINNPGPVTRRYSEQSDEAQTPQMASPPTTLVNRLRDVDQVLQRRIQEAILSGSMQQSGGAVPPEYSRMVDEYYRTLSKDVE